MAPTSNSQFYLVGDGFEGADEGAKEVRQAEIEHCMSSQSRASHPGEGRVSGSRREQGGEQGESTPD